MEIGELARIMALIMITVVVVMMALFVVVVLVRAFLTLVSIHRRRHLLSESSLHSPTPLLPPGETASLLVVLGSGGHTAEMLTLVGDVLPHFTPGGRISYVAGASDHHSLSKAKDLHSAGDDIQRSSSGQGIYVSYISLPRAREVGQSWSSSVGTSVITSAAALKLLWRERPHVILCNGPGTCAVVGAVAFSLRLLWPYRFANRVIYVESFARVETLSLSGKIMYLFSDRFVVQWQQLASKWPRSEHYGRLC